MVCHRCRKKTNIHTMSYFNEDEICMDCSDKERKHPDFKKARDADQAQIRNGNMNFAGIGKPSNL
tara:strand:- start:511 stop:705 length:195 start_codon:yes stop_codon:yes gene_type:complete